MLDGILVIYNGIVITKEVNENKKLNYNFQIIIQSVIRSIKIRDDVYCADLLIYEIKPEIELWKKMFCI